LHNDGYLNMMRICLSETQAQTHSDVIQSVQFSQGLQFNTIYLMKEK